MSQGTKGVMNDDLAGTRIPYFAYGSNMDTERLRSRVPSATVIGPAKLRDKLMVFNKRSTDGSGKANLVNSRGDLVWGVLYEVDLTELNKLDRAERGYDRTSLKVWTEQGHAVRAEVYISTELTADPVPYDWYKDLIIAAARQHQLPRHYVEYLQQLRSKPDQRRRRGSTLSRALQ